MDLSALPAMSVAMVEEPDEDALALCRELCTRTGMLFEDASAKAILTGDLPAGELLDLVEELQGVTKQARGLLAAAAVLVRDCQGNTIR